MLCCTQYAIDHGNQGDMSFNGAEAPHLILVQPFGLAFFVIDFNRPAMTANAGDALCPPDQTVADVEGRFVLQVSLTMVNDQALFAKAWNLMGVAVAVVDFLFTLVRYVDGMEDGLTPRRHRLQMLLFELFSKVAQRCLTVLQGHLGCLGQGTHIGQTQRLTHKPAEIWLGIPTVEGHRQLALGMSADPLLQQILGDGEFAVVEILDLGMAHLSTLPDTDEVAAPFVRRTRLQ